MLPRSKACSDWAVSSCSRDALHSRLWQLQGGFSEGRHRPFGHVYQRHKAKCGYALPAPPQCSPWRQLEACRVMPASVGRRHWSPQANGEWITSHREEQFQPCCRSEQPALSPAKDPASPHGCCVGGGDVLQFHRANS